MSGSSGMITCLQVALKFCNVNPASSTAGRNPDALNSLTVSGLSPISGDRLLPDSTVIRSRQSAIVSLMFRTSRILLTLACLAAFQCSAGAEVFRCAVDAHEPFLDQANRFILAGLRYQPVEATQAGYHGDASHPLDNQLDDSSPATIAAEHALLLSGKQCFAAT